MVSEFPVLWSFKCLRCISSMDNTYRNGDKPSSYSIKFLRYWFVNNLIQKHYVKYTRPLNILEVGVDKGQMNEYFFLSNEKNSVASWDAIDVVPQHEYLKKLNYNQIFPYNIDHGSPIKLNKKYDIIIMLHVLEHLYEPEACLDNLLPYLKTGGLIIGGAPTMPHVFSRFWEQKLRRKPKKAFGHVSVISPDKVLCFSEKRNLTVNFLSGAYLVRSHGSLLENSLIAPLWMKFNILFGYMFPSISNELYFSLSNSPKS